METTSSALPHKRSGSLTLAPAADRSARLEFFLAGATVFLAPMNFLRLPNFYITLSDTFALACIFVMILNRTVPLRPLGRGTPIWLGGLSLLVFGLLLGSLVHGEVDRGLIVSAQYVYTFLLLPLVLLGRPWAQTITLVKLFIASIVLMCLHGIYLIHVDGETNTQFVSGSGRLLGFVERDNECASLIAMTLPLLLWLGATGAIRQSLTWIAVLIMVYGVVLTGSNTGLFAMLCCFGIFLVATITWRKLVGYAVAAAIAVAVVGAGGQSLLPPVFQKRVLAALTSGNIEAAGTFSHRMDLIVESLETADSTILLGLGADQNRAVSAWGHPVHNVYLLVWTEGGLWSLIGIVLILLGAVVAASGALRHRWGWLSGACAITILTSFALLINATPHVYGRFWVVPLLLGIALSLACDQDGPIPERYRRFAAPRHRRRHRMAYAESSS